MTRRSSVALSAGRAGALGLEGGEDERVDGMRGPGRNVDVAHRAEGPVFGALLGRGPGQAARGGRGRRRGRLRRSHPDPRDQVGDRRFGEALLRGHLQVAVLVADGFDEQAFVGLAGDDGRPGVAALPDPLGRVEQEAALDLLGRGGVAGGAGVDEDRADPLLEEFDSRGVVLDRQSGQQRGLQQHHDEEVPERSRSLPLPLGLQRETAGNGHR